MNRPTRPSLADLIKACADTPYSYIVTHDGPEFPLNPDIYLYRMLSSGDVVEGARDIAEKAWAASWKAGPTEASIAIDENETVAFVTKDEVTALHMTFLMEGMPAAIALIDLWSKGG